MRASFNMKKVVYDVSDPVALCNNQTTKCTLPLGFLSNEQVSAWVSDIERGRQVIGPVLFVHAASSQQPQQSIN